MLPCPPTLLGFLCLPIVAQESAVPFDASVVTDPDAGATPFGRLLDFDGDNDLDAVGARDGKLRVWENDGSGKLSVVLDEVLLGAVENIQHVEVGDFNNDGLDDFVLAEPAGYRIHTSQGDGTFVSETTQTTPFLIDIAVGDFEGDGSDEVAALLGSFGTQSEIELSLSSGIDLEVTTSLSDADALFAFEADGDFTADLLVARGNTARIYRTGATGFLAADTFSLPFAVYHDWAVGDIDGDLDDDVVAFSRVQGTVDYVYDVFERVSPSGFVLRPTADGGPATELADVDGDGDLDGIQVDELSWPPGGPWYAYQDTFSVSINEGGFDIGFAHPIPMANADAVAGVGDLDNDGDQDLVAGVCIYYARKPFAGGADAPMPTMPFNPFTFRDYLIGDADRDGDPDPFPFTGPWNMGDGTFADVPQPDFPEAPAGQALSGPNWFGDFNGDGAWDAVYSRYDVSSTFEFVQHELIQNAGGGGFFLAGPASPFGAEWDPYENSVDNGTTADGDGDGDADLFIRANGFGSSISTVFYQNDGTGFFQPVWTLFKTRGELYADFNNDGHLDVFGTGSNETPTFRVFVGLPGAGAPYFDGPFGIAATAVPEEERQYTAYDFNDDGWLDISFVDTNGKPWLWFNTTSTPGDVPTFSTADFFGPDYTTDDFLRPRVIGLDANGDGLSDVIVGPFPDFRLGGRVFLRKPGTGGLLTLADYEEPILQVLTGLYPSDVDGDGDTDLFGSSISMNTTFDPSQGGGTYRQALDPGAGTDQMVPILGATGPFRGGETVKLKLSGAVGGTLSVLIFSQNPAELPDFPLQGVNTYVDPFLPGFAQIQLPVIGPAGVGGAGTWDPATPGFLVPAGLGGLTFHHQAFVIDPGAPTLVVHSNRVSITYGD